MLLGCANRAQLHQIACRRVSTVRHTIVPLRGLFARAGDAVPTMVEMVELGTDIDEFGASLRAECSSCGSILPEGAQFCPSCGHLVATVAEERRIVTVLFADLVGFTSMSEGRDPEAVKRIVDGCLRALVADVSAYGGTVDKLLGDAVLALFGAPVAHGDDAERAVRAAFALHETVRSYLADHVSPELAVDLGTQQLALRVGINTGEVLTGALRAGGDYTAMGDVVNVAQRLQTAAAPGEVLVGPLTHELTSRVIHFDELDPIALKGRSSKVAAWKALEAVAPPGRRVGATHTPLVGRQRELDLLVSFVELVEVQHRAGLIVLSGDAGLGKTRIAEEVAARAATDWAGRVLEGRCVPYGEANIWWPVAEAIMELAGINEWDPPERQYLRMVQLAVRALDLEPEDPEVRRCVSGLRYVLGDESALRKLEPARARDEAMRAIEMCVAGVARRQLVVLVASDVHWADQLVLDLLNRLLERLRTLPFVLLLTSRAPVDGITAPASSISMRVDPLTRAEADELVAALLGRPDPPPVLAELLYERSGGSPLFLEELVGYWTEAGIDLGAAAHPSFDSRVGDLPVTLRGVVAARLDGLDSRSRAALEDAAILGRAASVSALRSMLAAHGELAVDEVLDHLVDKSLLVLDDEDEWRFKSDVLREVAYDTLTKADRARRHFRAANWYESQPGHGWEQQRLELLAHHFATAAELSVEVGAIDGLPPSLRGRAIDALRRAAGAAVSRDMWPVSKRLVERALALGPNDDQAIELRIQLARSLAAMHDLVGARSHIEGIAEGTGGGAARLRAEALTVLGDIERREGQPEAAIRTLEQALDLWGELGDTEGAALTLRHLGMALLFQGDHQAAERAIRSALAEYEASGDERGQAWALQNLAWTSFSRGDTDSAEQWVERSAEKFTELGDFGGLGWAMGLLGWIRYFQGRLDEAGEIAESLTAHFGDFSDRWADGMLNVLLASVRLWQGDSVGAITRAQHALTSMESINDGWGTIQALVALSRALVCAGRVAEGRECVGRLRALSSSDQTALGGALGALAAAAIEDQVGDGARALELLPDSVGNREVGGDEFWASRIIALVHLGRVEEAIALATRPDVATAGRTSRYLACARGYAFVASGRLAELEDVLTPTPGGSYLDEVGSWVLRALAATREGHAGTAEEAIGRARQRVDQTSARLDQAVVRIAEAVIARRFGRIDAADIEASARARMELIDVSPQGWFTTFSLCAGLT